MRIRANNILKFLRIRILGETPVYRKLELRRSGLRLVSWPRVAAGGDRRSIHSLRVLI